MKALLRREDGMAMITSLLVVLIVGVLSVVALQISRHDTEQSARHRKRVQAIGAAEAGVNWYFSHLQTATPATLGPCETGTQPVDAAAGTSFSATVTYYASDGSVIPCANPAGIEPAKALISSVGSSSGTGPERRMESLVNLLPIRGGALSGTAMFSQDDITLKANVQVFSGLGMKADIYTNATFSAQTNDLIEGSIFAQGTVSLHGSGQNTRVTRGVWGGQAVTLSSGFPVGGTVRSATSISVGGSIGGDAIAPTVTPASPSVAGQVILENPGLPPTRPFPQFVYDPVEWQASGYSIHNFSDCSTAENFLADTYPALTEGKHLIRVTHTTCTFRVTKKTTLRGDLAILVSGPIDVRPNTGFRAPDDASYDMHLFAGAGTPGPSVCGSGKPGFTLQSNNVADQRIRTVVYAPGAVVYHSNGRVLDGQIFGCTVDLASNSFMVFYPVFVPGTQITGYNQDLVYTREEPTT